MTNHEQTVATYYARIIVMFQGYIKIADEKKELTTILQKKRPKYFRKAIWDEAIDQLLEYIKTHKYNFKDGKLYA